MADDNSLFNAAGGRLEAAATVRDLRPSGPATAKLP